jgi:hypothetical protein
MNCPECTRLMAEHQRLKRLYANAVELLFATGYQATDAEYKKLKNAIREAREQSEIARTAVDKHAFFAHSKAG